MNKKLVFILASLTIIFGPSMVSAAVEVSHGCSSTRVIFNNPIPNQVFKPGDTVTFQVSALNDPDCYNVKGPLILDFFITEDKSNIPVVDCRNRGVSDINCSHPYGIPPNDRCVKEPATHTWWCGENDKYCVYVKYVDAKNKNFRITQLGRKNIALKAGQWANFSFQYKIPATWPGGAARLYVGFYSIGFYSVRGTTSDWSLVYQPIVINTNKPPQAAIYCDPKDSPTACQKDRDYDLALINDSTDPDGVNDIVESQWWIKGPTGDFVWKTTCPGKCNYNPSTGVEGNYIAKLIVKDSEGIFSETTKDYTILAPAVNRLPQAKITCNPSCVIWTGETMFFENDSTDPDGASDIVSSQWYYNECIGSATFYLKSSCNTVCDYHPTEAEVKNVWPRTCEGKRTIKLEIRDSYNHISTITQDIEIKSHNPVAKIACSPPEAKVPGVDQCEVFKDYSLTLENASTDSDSTNPPDNNNDIVRSDWYIRLSDGSYPSTPNLSCPGNPKNCPYEIPTDETSSSWARLRVYDAAGNRSTYKELNFRVKRDILADFNCSLDGITWSVDCLETDFKNLKENQTVYLRDASVASDGAIIATRTWTAFYQDGTMDGTPAFESNSDKPSFVVTREGEIRIFLVVTDTKDRLGTTDKQMESVFGSENNPPSAAITCICEPLNPNNCNPATCEVFKGTSSILKLRNDSTDPEGNIVKSRWYKNFPGEDYTDCEGICDYTPQDIGSFRARLEVEDEEGPPSSSAEQDYKVKQDIIADFQCSLDSVEDKTWEDCDIDKFKTLNNKTIVYLKDISTPSTGATKISSWSWVGNYSGGDSIEFDPGSNVETPSFEVAKKEKITISLSVRDDNNRSKTISKNLSSIPPPKWWPISFLDSLFAEVYRFIR